MSTFQDCYSIAADWRGQRWLLNWIFSFCVEDFWQPFLPPSLSHYSIRYCGGAEHKSCLITFAKHARDICLGIKQMFEVNSRSGLQAVNGRFVKKRLRRPSLVSSLDSGLFLPIGPLLV
jgi:hypothetical protein